jgi:uncharacterized membrane protein YjjP (DUF1212 family)
LDNGIFVGENASPEHFTDKLLRTSLDVAENIIKNGGTVRVSEEAVERICRAHGAVHVEVFSIPSVIIASVRMGNGEYSMQTRRIYGCNNDFTKLDKLNSISRDLCSRKITLDEAQALISQTKNKPSFSKPARLISSMVISGAFAIFFGGTILDGIAASILGLLIAFLSMVYLKNMNTIARSLVLSAVAGILAIVFARIGFGNNYDKIIIGTIMLVVPGLSFGNSLRDLLYGDTLSGILQLIQSILLATVIAFGYTFALLTVGSLVL